MLRISNFIFKLYGIGNHYRQNQYLRLDKHDTLMKLNMWPKVTLKCYLRLLYFVMIFCNEPNTLRYKFKTKSIHQCLMVDGTYFQKT